MLDIGWPELVVIGAVALVAIGPKDLPRAMYKMGQWAGKMRAFAHDVHRAMEQVASEAESAERMKQPPPAPATEIPEKPHDPAAS